MEASETRGHASLLALVPSVGRHCRRAPARHVRHSGARIRVALSRPWTDGPRSHDARYAGNTQIYVMPLFINEMTLI